MKLTQLLMIVMAINTFACADDLVMDQEMSVNEKLLNSTLSSAHPEVGLFQVRMNGQGGSCTGTLIRPNVVLTAAHCINYMSGASSFGSMLFDAGEYAVKGALSFDQTTGAEDIALLELAQSVPSSRIRPASLHQGSPMNGARAEIYGYGCNDRQTEEGEYLFQKQTVSFTVGQGSSNLCPGDSGGPVFVNGSVAYVNSAYYIQGGGDVYAEVGFYHEVLNQYSDQLAQQGAAAVIRQLQEQQNGGQANEANTQENSSSQGSANEAPENNGASDANQDICSVEGYYNDGYCDTFCAQPDPDCNTSANPESENNGNTPAQEETNNEEDVCAVQGYYNDGICDEFCLMVDPDCGF